MDPTDVPLVPADRPWERQKPGLHRGLDYALAASGVLWWLVSLAMAIVLIRVTHDRDVGAWVGCAAVQIGWAAFQIHLTRLRGRAPRPGPYPSIW